MTKSIVEYNIASNGMHPKNGTLFLSVQLMQLKIKADNQKLHSTLINFKNKLNQILKKNEEIKKQCLLLNSQKFEGHLTERQKNNIKFFLNASQKVIVESNELLLKVEKHLRYTFSCAAFERALIKFLVSLKENKIEIPDDIQKNPIYLKNDPVPIEERHKGILIKNAIILSIFDAKSLIHLEKRTDDILIALNKCLNQSYKTTKDEVKTEPKKEKNTPSAPLFPTIVENRNQPTQSNSPRPKKPVKYPLIREGLLPSPRTRKY